MLNVDADKVEINAGHWIKLRNSSGKTWTIPIDEWRKWLINYRNQDRFPNFSFYILFRTLAHHYQDGTVLPPECNIKNKVLLVGGAAIGLDDLGPTPLLPKSPLAFVHLNAINNVLHNDYL